MRAIICDRCDQRTNEINASKVTVEGGGSKTTTMDLCHVCTKQLREWLKGTPRVAERTSVNITAL